MGRNIADSGGGDFSPTANLKEKVGAMVKGVMEGHRLVKTKFGEKPVFSLKVLDADCSFTVSGSEVSPNEGDKVDIFAPTRLAKQLAQVTTGETVTIKYLGLGKNKKGNPPHTFEVEVA